MDMKCKTILWRLVWFSTYVLIGAVIFMHLENNDDNNLSGIASENSLTDQLMRALNISRENITAVIKDYCQGFCACREKKKSWSFLNSIDFVLQLLTTIGKIVFVCKEGKMASNSIFLIQGPVEQSRSTESWEF